MTATPFRRFLVPRLNWRFLPRLLLVALAAAVVFTQALLPLRIQGNNMEPAYRDGAFNFCWRGRYLFAEPARGDVVAIHYAGQRVVMLKRVIALAGDTVEFRNGTLLVNDALVQEPYAHAASGWNVPPLLVEPDMVYVADDNRAVPLGQRIMGQVERARIVGGVLW